MTRRQFLATTALAAASFGCATPKNARTASEELCVMTYNLRFASDTPPNAWAQRRPAMAALLREARPDVIGTQEGVYRQLKDLAADLPEFDWIGLGRDGGSRGEFMAVFFRRDRLEPLAYDHFWLSDTPEVIASSTWGNTNKRMLTWVRFRDRVTGKEFEFWNTHLDHALQPAREKAATLIRARIAQVPASRPLLLVGDFNAEAKRNPVYEMLTRDAGLIDTWYTAGSRSNEDVNTFNGFAPAVRGGERIDWILARPGTTTRHTEVLTRAPGGQVPSDHFPVVSWLRPAD
jgi:endonuclease/exonuclease/phosphatase family metal-dependent hydrolase